MRCVYEAVAGMQPDSRGRTQYRCTECGHRRWSKYPPALLTRPCPAANHTSPREKRTLRIRAARRRLERDIATDITPDTRPMDAIRKTLDKCFGGCRHMRGICTRWGTCGYERKQAWYEYLLENDCNDNNHV